MRTIPKTKILSPREREIARLLVAGVHRRKAIADRLGIAPDTVHFHLDNLRFKLGVDTTPEAIVVLFRNAGAGEIADQAYA